MVPEIKTSSLWNIVEVAQFPYQDTGTNLYVLQHEFEWIIRVGAMLRELNISNATWEETTKQKTFVFYFLFSSSSLYSSFLLSYLISGLNFYRVLTYLALTWKKRKKKGWSPTCKNSWGWLHRAFFSSQKNNVHIYFSMCMYCRNKLLFLVWGALVSSYSESLLVCSTTLSLKLAVYRSIIGC